MSLLLDNDEQERWGHVEIQQSDDMRIVESTAMEVKMIIWNNSVGMMNQLMNQHQQINENNAQNKKVERPSKDLDLTLQHIQLVF